MEGVVDSEMRSVLTQIGGYDRCVTEFVRVTEQRLPDHVFRRFCPELDTGGTTPSGTPVYLQLLGGNAHWMGINAGLAQKLEPLGIDLNFGCPSKTVNKSDGGSALLKEPQRVGDIVAAVRDAVDPSIAVTAKIRLGFSNHDFLDEITDQVVRGGASQLCIHARTRDDRYKPPAYWHVVKSVSDRVSIPIVINGEIWSPEDAQAALEQSGCEHLMLGRGALSCPDLAKRIKQSNEGTADEALTWDQTLEIMQRYLRTSCSKHPMFVSNRSKQWLAFLRMHFPQAAELFTLIKRLKVAEDVFAVIDSFSAKTG
ncbi:MAG: tRNA-dihydrouridine synthase C [Cryomorphaceae bacterium]|jgi:tRNA-dihydrouridine synthase C